MAPGLAKKGKARKKQAALPALKRAGYSTLMKQILRSFDAEYVQRVLVLAGGNISLAARVAQVDRKHLWRLMRRCGIWVDGHEVRVRTRSRS